ncbi:hypothetical protein Misp06_02909 [Microbulbifer sp. NBRC 101763]
MWLPFNSKVWFYRQPIDFRKQMDGIVLLVADTLHKDPTSGQLFIFRNKKADKFVCSTGKIKDSGSFISEMRSRGLSFLAFQMIP